MKLLRLWRLLLLLLMLLRINPHWRWLSSRRRRRPCLGRVIKRFDTR